MKKSNLKQMKEIAQKAMCTGKFTVGDVKNDLKEYRESDIYKSTHSYRK